MQNDTPLLPEAPQDPIDLEEDSKSGSLLSFKPLGRILSLDAVEGEFRSMQGVLKKPLTIEAALRVCTKSGSHLLKMVSARVDGDHAVLRINEPNTNRRSSLLPSTNAADISFAKVLYRPLEVEGFTALSVVDHILNPEEISDRVLEAFAQVFGKDVLDAIKDNLLNHPPHPRILGTGEFPIVFVPRPGGGDLQISPVSPAAAFMGLKRSVGMFFQKANKDAPHPRRGRWTHQAISTKPQNISGAIGGPRLRFLATLPPGLKRTEAELYRYANGGRFPTLHDPDISVWVLRYAKMLDADEVYNNHHTRDALNRVADRLIADAVDFIQGMRHEGREVARNLGRDPDALPAPPPVATILFKTGYANENERAIAQKALTSPHFQDRLRKNKATQEDVV